MGAGGTLPSSWWDFSSDCWSYTLGRFGIGPAFTQARQGHSPYDLLTVRHRTRASGMPIVTERDSERRRSLAPLWGGGVVLLLLLLAIFVPVVRPIEVRRGHTDIWVSGTLTYAPVGLGESPLPQGFSHWRAPDGTVNIYTLRLGSCAYWVMRQDWLP